MSHRQELSLETIQPIQDSRLLPGMFPGTGTDNKSFPAHWLSAGPVTKQFEQAIQTLVGAKHAVAVNSCAAALHLALCAVGVSENDGVITSALAFPTTGHAIMYQKARPFLIDIEPKGFHLDPEKVRLFLETECIPGPGGRPRHVATGKTIKAILPVHFAGIPCRMGDLLDLAETYRLWLIEDASKAVGAEYGGLKLGGFGHLTCFAFGSTSDAMPAQGGMLVTSDEYLAQKARLRSTFGISDVHRSAEECTGEAFDVAALGFNYQMMDIQAAAALSRLGKLENTLKARMERAAVYEKILGSHEEITRPSWSSSVRPAWQGYPIILPDKANSDADRTQLIEQFRAIGLEIETGYSPLHLYSYYQRALPYRFNDFPIAETAAGKMIILPTSPETPISTVEASAKILDAYFRS